LVRLALEELEDSTHPTVIQTAMAVVALGRGCVRLGALLNHLDEAEIEELAGNLLAWADLYDAERQPRIAG
jgi:hypothetical protein